MYPHFYSCSTVLQFAQLHLSEESRLLLSTEIRPVAIGRWLVLDGQLRHYFRAWASGTAPETQYATVKGQI